MAYSTDVSAGDTVLASQYNNLRKDLLDTSLGHTHSGTDSKYAVVGNALSVTLATDFSGTNPNYTARTGGTITVNVKKANGIVAITLSSTWRLSNSDSVSMILYCRINRDSGTEYLQMFASSIPNNAYAFVGGRLLFTGLSVGNHTFVLEVVPSGSSGTSTAYNNCTASDYHFVMCAEEL